MKKQDKDYLEMQADHGRILIYDGQALISNIISSMMLLEHDMLNGEEFSSDERTTLIQIAKDCAIRYQDLMDGCKDQLRDYQKKSRGE